MKKSYHKEICEREEQSSKLWQDRETGPEQRKDNHIARRLKLNKIKGEVEK